jgi:hypothetical protein
MRSGTERMILYIKVLGYSEVGACKEKEDIPNFAEPRTKKVIDKGT